MYCIIPLPVYCIVPGLFYFILLFSKQTETPEKSVEKISQCSYINLHSSAFKSIVFKLNAILILKSPSYYSSCHLQSFHECCEKGGIVCMSHNV